MFHIIETILQSNIHSINNDANIKENHESKGKCHIFSIYDKVAYTYFYVCITVTPFVMISENMMYKEKEKKRKQDKEKGKGGISS